jgi:hypothetical protein
MTDGDFRGQNQRDPTFRDQSPVHGSTPPFHRSQILQIRRLNPSQFSPSVFCKSVARTLINIVAGNIHRPMTEYRQRT